MVRREPAAPRWPATHEGRLDAGSLAGSAAAPQAPRHLRQRVRHFGGDPEKHVYVLGRMHVQRGYAYAAAEPE